MLLDELRRLENEAVLFVKDSSIQCPACKVGNSIKGGKQLSRENPVIRLKSCLHEICKECIVKAASQSTNPYVACPLTQCQIAISERELRALCGEAVLSRLHDMEVTSVLDSTSQNGFQLFDALKKLHTRKFVECENGTLCHKCCPEGGRQLDRGEHSVVRLQSCLHEICKNCIVESAKKSAFLPVKCPLERCEFHVMESELRAICPENVMQTLDELTRRSQTAIGNCKSCVKTDGSFDICWISFELAFKGSNVTQFGHDGQMLPKQSKHQKLRQLENAHAKNVFVCESEVSCPICFESVDPSQNKQNKVIRLMSCLHEVCQRCLQQWTDASTDPVVKCPIDGCELPISECELVAICSPKVIKKLHHMSLTRAPALKGEFVAVCFSKNCPGMAVFDEFYNVPNASLVQNGPIFQCPLCLKENCLSCKIQHPNETCIEYKHGKDAVSKDKYNWKLSEHDAKMRIKSGTAMICPRCKVLIERISGCDGISCTMCKLNICWATKGPRWGPRGIGDTSGGCGCSSIKKCHPNCRNCH